MFLLIKDGIKFTNIKIESSSSFSIYEGIDLEQRGIDFFFILKDGLIFDDGESKSKIECKKYIVKRKKEFNDIEIYVYVNKEGFDEYFLYENKPLLIANHNKANILLNDPYLKNNYLYINNGRIETNYDCLLVNGKKYNQQIIKEDDEIRFHNLFIIFYKSYLYINNFLIDNKLKEAEVQGRIVEYKINKAVIKNSYQEPIRKLEIDELKEFEGFKITNKRNLIYQIGPSLTMSFSMIAVAVINAYNNQNLSILNIVLYILMPATMLISGVLWPLLSDRSERKLIEKENETIKKDYLFYLNNYKDKTKEIIDIYIKNENKYLFNKLKNNDELFTITNKSTRFLNISIGSTSIKKEIITKKTDDKEIDEKLKEIEGIVNNINSYPCFVDVLKYQIISVVSNKDIKDKIVKQYLIELASKYHYDDFYLGIYSQNIKDYYGLFSIPQLVFNNRRITLDKKSELQEINNYKYNKPLILFICDKNSYEFTNKEIHVIYFCEKINDIYKNSNLLIEYQKNYGFIHGDDKIAFNYILNDYNLDDVNRLFSPYQKISYVKKIYSFKDINSSFNIKKNYLSKQLGLKADFSIINNELLSFDLHESKQGPHGLIGGSTGSGKSELIISLLLSLCMRYRPDYLNLILIDYKGGGIKESLSYNKKVVPHVVASIDNLETEIFERLMIAIDFECKRRQRLFKELSYKSSNSIMNIDDYLNIDYSSYGLQSIAHLIIVVDEFAELKKENPEVIKELISFSRIGRSLGIHLILATQRPNGIIDDEIWSNSRFKIALKVFNEKDSNDIIKSKDAAYLNNPGEFYISVDDSLQKAISLYSKKDINENDSVEVALLDNRLDVYKQKIIKQEKSLSEASYIVKEIIEATRSLNIQTSLLNFNKPNPLNKNDIIIKYGNTNEIILGEIDDYVNFKNDILKVPSDQNIFIFSTRKKEIYTILNCLTKRTIIIGEDRYENSLISDSLLYDEIDDINYLFEKLLKENEKITLLIEDLNCLLAYDENILVYLIQLLRRNVSSNINIIIISKFSVVNIKLLSCFKYKYVIEMNEKQDLLNIFSSCGQCKGKSFYFDEEVKSFIPLIIEDYKKESCFISPYVKHIPKVIKTKTNINGILLGYDNKTRKEVYLSKNDRLLISSYDEKTIEFYKTIFNKYENIDIELYNKSKVNDENIRILWIGEGLFNQRLFYAEGKEDLNESEAYLFKGNKGTRLRVVNCE